jgi:hypothetical protein
LFGGKTKPHRSRQQDNSTLLTVSIVVVIDIFLRLWYDSILTFTLTFQGKRKKREREQQQKKRKKEI